MNAYRPPTATEQLAFIRTVQRLFDEGEFVATYKFALLIALTELAVERGDDSGEPLALPLSAIAEKFIELYWFQAAPYSSGQPGTIIAPLGQNKGRQAAIVNRVSGLRADASPTLAQARQSPNWQAVVASVARVVEEMPLWKLQTMRRQKVCFLYEHQLIGSCITLLPGVAYNLRQSHGMIQHLARGAWVLHVRSNPLNRRILGEAADLESFMFGADRAALGKVCDLLIDVQKHQCFYCKGTLRQRGEVDHFVPWSRYPRDLAQNFVLAHAGCNRDKSDLLAAPAHVAKWRERNEEHKAVIDEALARTGVQSDGDAMLQVARWAYHQAYQSESQAWVAIGNTVRLDRAYEPLLAS